MTKRMNKTKRSVIASRVARKLVHAGVASTDAVVTGTVQHCDDGSAWVHMMVFVPAVDTEEEAAQPNLEGVF